MSYKTNIIIAFVLAVFMHIMVCVSISYLVKLSSNGLTPLFKNGESSIEISIIPPIDNFHVNIEDHSDIPEPSEIIENKEQKTEIDINDNTELKDEGVETFFISENEIRPRYPFASRLRGEHGVVEVKAYIGLSGKVQNIEIIESSGYSSLDIAALKAVRDAKFISKGDNIKEEGSVVLRFRFKLTDQ